MAREEGFFDELARGLADGSLTRGKALRLMGAAVVGGTLGSLGIGEASADAPGCKRAGKNCTRNTQCCSSLVCVSGTCQTQTTTPTPTTTTTETPTTTTTETPTTTTTETPTTTTTETPTTTTTETPTTTTSTTTPMPTAAALITCQCADETLSGCSINCSQADQLCANVCISFGGVRSVQCSPNDPLCA
jgi:hypothetical protein